MIHHVGIVCSEPEAARILATMNLVATTPWQIVDDLIIDQWACRCLLYRQHGTAHLEIVVPFPGGKLHDWWTAQGHAAIHHVALAVKSCRTESSRLAGLGVPLVSPDPVRGVAGCLVNFIHPSYCGVLLEIVEVPRVD